MVEQVSLGFVVVALVKVDAAFSATLDGSTSRVGLPWSCSLVTCSYRLAVSSATIRRGRAQATRLAAP